MKKINNVLWSGRSYGGGEIYCASMKRHWKTSTIALEDLSFTGWMFLLRNILIAEEVFIFHDFRASLLALLAPWKINNSVILGPGKNLALTKGLIRILAKIQRHVILVDTDLMPSRPASNTIVVENFSDAGIIASNTSRDAVYIGRLAETKRVLELCDVWRRVDNGAYLHLIGDGLEREAVNNFAASNDRLVVHGALPHEAIATVASKCSYYISLSRQEGRSLSLLEAMGGGLLPIITDIPSQAFLKNIEGALILNDDGSISDQIKCFFSNIDNVADDKREQLRTTMRALVKAQFYDSWLTFWEAEIASLRSKNIKKRKAQ